VKSPKTIFKKESSEASLPKEEFTITELGVLLGI
jgi:hypothetical protein